MSRAGPNAKVGRLVPNRRRRVMGFVAGPIPFNIPSDPTRRAEDSQPYLRNHPPLLFLPSITPQTSSPHPEFAIVGRCWLSFAVVSKPPPDLQSLP
jgi:hypothetical protein